MPAGSATWPTTLAFTNKMFTLHGSGTNQTIITDGCPTVSGRRLSLFRVKLTATNGSVFRMTGFQIKGGTNTTPAAVGIINVISTDNETNNALWRIDNIYFNRTFGGPAYVNAWSGLMDHLWIDQGGSSGFVFDGRIPDASNRGHRSWATDVRWGTVDAGVYVEDCFITNSVQRAITDGFGGARFVFRHNTCYNVSVENHGTESTGVFRGTRSMEVYANDLTSTAAGECAVLFRSGTGLVFSNTVSGHFPALMRLANFRERDVYLPYGQATGTNGFDLNFTNLVTGTVTGGTNNSTILTDSSSTWTTNQWVGWHVYNTSDPYGRNAEVLSNYNHNLTVWLAGITATNTPHWTNGNGYAFVKMDRELDGVGQGKGDMLVGGQNCCPALVPTPSYVWPHQVDEPVRFWDNVGINTLADAGYSAIIPGRNWTNAPLPGYTPFVYPHPLSSGDTNTPPTIAPIPNITITQDEHTVPIVISLGAGKTNVASYAVSTASSLVALVPNSGTNYIFGGSGASRTVTIYPKPSQFGMAAITLTVTDEKGNTAATSFFLTVNQIPNTAPTIVGASDQSITALHSTAVITLTVSDAETAVEDLAVIGTSNNQSVIPDSHIKITGSGAIRYAVIDASDMDGSATVTFTVYDSGVLNGTCACSVTVRGNSTQSPSRYRKALTSRRITR